MNDKKILDHFMEQLEFHSVKYVGQSEKEDWYIVKTTNEMAVLINEDGDIMSYAKHLYRDSLEYKYTEDYILLAGRLYKNQKYSGSELEEVKGYYDYYEDYINNIIFYEGTGLLELVWNNNQSLFMYHGKLIKSGMIGFFLLPKNAVKEVCWENGVMRLETITGNYYMSITNNRVYSDKTRCGKKLKKIFFASIEY